MKNLIALLFVLILTGCETTGVLIEETPLNVSDTRKVISSVIGQPRMVSQNGRELYSRYFDRNGRYPENIDKAKERLHTVVIVLGDRRPYTIKVEVLVEVKLHDDLYELSDRDDKMAEKLAAQIKAALYQSQNNRNVIDDFRPM